MGANEGVTQILNLSTEQLDRAAELDKLRRNITVLFTDLKGSTAYFEKYGDSAGLLMVHQCNTTLGQIVEKHGGRVIKTIGDAVMAAFEDCHEGIAAAIEMQEAITSVTYGKQGPEKISIRIGLNYGLGIVKSNDVFGDVVRPLLGHPTPDLGVRARRLPPRRDRQLRRARRPTRRPPA
jgi:class 3 adenylate cyclase